MSSIEQSLASIQETLAVMEQRLSVIERETFDVSQSRLARNTEAETVALRAEAYARQGNQRLNSLAAEIRGHEKREQLVLKWESEIERDLGAHVATPQPTHGVDRDLWIRRHEELTETLDEIRRGPSSSSSGYLRDLARRDGAPLTPCLIATQNALGVLRAELEAVETS